MVGIRDSCILVLVLHSNAYPLQHHWNLPDDDCIVFVSALSFRRFACIPLDCRLFMLYASDGRHTLAATLHLSHTKIQPFGRSIAAKTLFTHWIDCWRYFDCHRFICTRWICCDAIGIFQSKYCRKYRTFLWFIAVALVLHRRFAHRTRCIHCSILVCHRSNSAKQGNLSGPIRTVAECALLVMCVQCAQPQRVPLRVATIAVVSIDNSRFPIEMEPISIEMGHLDSRTCSTHAECYTRTVLEFGSPTRHHRRHAQRWTNCSRISRSG